jgi:hypothetical protein
MQVYGFNNLGPVLGEAGDSSVARGEPYVWTNGVPTALLIPPDCNDWSRHRPG